MATKKKVVHIHLHTIYSIADAMSKPEDLAKRAAELGIEVLCVTDHGNISSIIQMKKACDKYGIKLIPGCEMYESPDRLIKTSRDDNYHVTMLPVDNQGWQDLKNLIADANEKGFYYNPRTDMKYIKDNNLGRKIIATSGCLGSYTSQLLMAGKYEEAKEEMLRRNDIFYKYYLEVQDNGSREQMIVNQQLVQLSEETGIPLVYAKDVHYVLPEHKDPHHGLVAIGRSKGKKQQTIYDCVPYPGTNTYHLASADEVYAWADEENIPHEAIENTVKIGEMCNVDILLGQNLLPEFEFCPVGYNPETYLKKLLYDNLIQYLEKCATKGIPINARFYIERIEREYQVITMKGFPSYFLMLWDILLWATDRDQWMSYDQNSEWLNKEVINKEGKKETPNKKYEFYPEYLVGPGRGSAAGSLMAFLLDITRLDPIEYGLLFERFLNPYRNSMPDIDVDFPGTNHDMLLDFVAQRYGRDKTAQIKTFTFFKIKSTIERVAKALAKYDKKGKLVEYGMPVAMEFKALFEKYLGKKDVKMPDQDEPTYKVLMEICMEPKKFERYGASLSKMIEFSREFRNLMDKYQLLSTFVKEIEGAIVSNGLHAGGVIISKRPVALDCPVIPPEAEKGAVLPVTTWDYPDCEELGLLKMDLLRTSTLRVISQAIEMIEEKTGEKIDIYDIGREDDEVFNYISQGQTHGMFQINGFGITRYTKDVQPEDQNELIDIIALFRPGPLDGTLDNGNTIAHQYSINKGKTLKNYLNTIDPTMREVLEETRGVMVYQEQIMQLVQKVAGYNLGHADTFRKVIGKKKISEMPKLYDDFVYGHKYVIKKWEDILNNWDKKKTLNDNDEEVIVVKDYEDNDVSFTKVDAESILKGAKKAMSAHEIKGAVNMGYSEEFSHQLFSEMAMFARYGFNKSHSACYADESYQTAWLKKYYPTEFMTAVLTVRGENKDDTLENLKETKNMGIKILRPDINKSFKEFTPETDGIRFGLTSIADVGDIAIDDIINIRKNGSFTSFKDFIDRTDFKGCKVNRTHYRQLIKAGCFDDFEPNRYKLLNYFNFDVRGDKVFDGTEEELASKDNANIRKNHSIWYDASTYTEKIMLEMERTLIGVFISGSPYDGLPYTSLSDMNYSKKWGKKDTYDIGGRIVKVTNFKSGKGCRIELETQLEPFVAVFFGKEFKDAQQHLYKDNIVVVRGYKNKNVYQGKEEDQFIAEKIMTREAKKLKREMGVKQDKPIQKPKDPILEQIEEETKPEPKKDLAAELFDEKPKRTKKRKTRRKKLKEDDIFVF